MHNKSNVNHIKHISKLHLPPHPGAAAMMAAPCGLARAGRRRAQVCGCRSPLYPSSTRQGWRWFHGRRQRRRTPLWRRA